MHSSESRAEAVARELLTIRGWKATRPPKGNLLWKNEYRDYPELTEAFAGRGKQGHGGDGYPDFLLLDAATLRPMVVGETKAREDEIGTAVKEAQDYSAGLLERGIQVLAAGVAGDDSGNIAVQVDKWAQNKWKAVAYRSQPIQWIPTPEEASRLLTDTGLFDLQPRVPPAEILAKRGDEINRILRESKIKDEFRPAIMGAFMLALWQSKGNVRTDAEHVLRDINEACKRAFVQAGKPDLAESLLVPEQNEKLAARAQYICYILRLLNITTLTAEHDYLGQLYETFFRFTGGNTIGQYFTPRHITRFMTDICAVSTEDFVLDPACGTGGFLIASLQKMQEYQHLTGSQLDLMVKKHLRGYEAEPITAALCVANMILRGDGKTGIIRGDCFTDPTYPENQATVVLGNPPFPHAKTDDPPEKFINRGLEALTTRGTLAMIVPGSLLVKGAKRKWRAKVLKGNSLDAVITLPAELFQPYASSTTAILVLERGVSHSPQRKTFFAHIENDGYRLKKKTRIPQPGSQLLPAIEAYFNHKSLPGLCSWAHVGREGAEWAPGAYIEATTPDVASIREQSDWLVRSLVAFHAQYAPELQEFLQYLKRPETPIPESYEAVTKKKAKVFQGTESNSIASLFNIYYGQPELENKENLGRGPSPVISSTGTDNGCYGFYDFEGIAPLIKPPFVTVPRTGSIGEAFVQLWPCGATSDVLLLIPKAGTDLEDLFLAACTVRLDRWRFNYGRKITPSRIAYMKINRDPELKRHIRASFDNGDVLMREARAVLGGGIDGDFGETITALAAQWRKETGHLSSIERKAMHPAYQSIIATGKRGVPYILRELKERGGHWFWALHYMTGVDIGEITGVEQMRTAWLSWGKKQGYVDL